jgi:hypothetical protein
VSVISVLVLCASAFYAGYWRGRNVEFDVQEKQRLREWIKRLDGGCDHAP